MIHDIAPYLAMALILKLGNGMPAIRACAFLIIIDSISLWHNDFLVLDNPWVMFTFSLISLIFARLSLNSSIVSIISYCGFSTAYFLLGIEDKINRGGVMDMAFYEIMYGLVALLVFSVTYDRMGGIKLRANSFMP